MVAETMLGGCEHSSTINSNTTARTLRKILSLTVAYGLHGKLPESFVEQAELEIVDRRADSEGIKCGYSVIKLILIVDWVDPELI